jgi:transposase
MSSDAIIEHLTAEGITAGIPPRSNRMIQRAFDKHRYKSCNLVEQFFCRIKQLRHTTRRHDKRFAVPFIRSPCCQGRLAGLNAN